MRVLVAYASKYGATEGIAQRIGARLRERGHDVDVVPCKAADASGYDAYVVGSAVHEGRWRKAARRFIEEHSHEFATSPLWLFSSGPLGTQQVDEDGTDVLEAAEPKDARRYEALLHPRGSRVFRGAYDHEQLRGADRMIVWMPAVRGLLPTGDFREWDAIGEWASSIADELDAGASTAP